MQNSDQEALPKLIFLLLGSIDEHLGREFSVAETLLIHPQARAMPARQRLLPSGKRLCDLQ